MPTNSVVEKDAYYKSICDVRKSFKLGCSKCVLFNFKECPQSDGTEPSCGNHMTKLQNIGSSGGRDLGGYTIHLPYGLSLS